VGMGVVVDDYGGVQGVFTKVDMIMALFKDADLLNARLRAIYQAMHNGLVSVDGAGHVIMLNPAAEALLGVCEQDVLGRHVEQAFPGLNLAMVMETGQEKVGKKWEYGGRALLVNCTPVLDGGRTAGAMAIFQDFTELEQVAAELELKEVGKSYGSLPAVQGISLTLYQGETIALVGESGSGKTTLAKTIMGLFKNYAGEILLEGQRHAPGDKTFYAKVQMIFQNPGESISHRMNVRQAVQEPLNIRNNASETEKLALVKRVLNEVELPCDDVFLRKYPHHLSGGEAQRVAIARALVLTPRVLVADEPTSALDASVQAKILKLLLNLQEKRGLAILLITHDIALAKKVSDKLAVMVQGRIVEAGPAGEVVNNPRHVYTKRLLALPPAGCGCSNPEALGLLLKNH